MAEANATQGGGITVVRGAAATADGVVGLSCDMSGSGGGLASVLANLLRVIMAAALILATPTLCRAQVKESRVALVVGNAAYPGDSALRNPVNDARAMAKVLEQAGFEVILAENTTRRALTEAFRRFIGQVVPGGVGLFYYAGHGMQVRGANYLVPIDAALSSDFDLRYETLDVNDVLTRLDESRVRLSLIILDACRDNPFARRFRSNSGGLAALDAPRGAFIAYATAPGQTAADGEGSNGLFTTELLKTIATPGLTLEEVFKRTSNAVAQRSADRQLPWVASSFRGEFYFLPPAPVPAAPPPPPAVPREAIEHAAWTAIASSSDPAAFELFLRRFPDGVYADFARQRLRELAAQKAARDASQEQERQRVAAAADETKRRADAEAEARRVAAEDAKRRADAEAESRRAAAEEAKRRAEAESRRVAAEEAKRRADAEARQAAAEEAKRRADAEAESRRVAAEEARRKAQADADEARRKAQSEADAQHSAETIERALQLSDTQRRRVQAALAIQGFDAGAADGQFGARTRQMLAAWQRARKLPATGFLDAVQLAALIRDTEEAYQRQEAEKRRLAQERDEAEAAKRKADAERPRETPPPPAAPPPPTVASVPPAAPGAPADGRWKGTFCVTGTSALDISGCYPVSASVSAGRLQGRLDAPTRIYTFSAHCDAQGGLGGMMEFVITQLMGTGAPGGNKAGRATVAGTCGARTISLTGTLAVGAVQVTLSAP